MCVHVRGTFIYTIIYLIKVLVKTPNIKVEFNFDKAYNWETYYMSKISWKSTTYFYDLHSSKWIYCIKRKIMYKK